MEINVKAVKMKLDHYCESKNMTQLEFAKTLDMTRQTYQNMLSGRQNFTNKFFIGIIRNYPDIDLHALFDNNPQNVSIVADSSNFYSGSTREKRLETAIKQIEEIARLSQK